MVAFGLILLLVGLGGGALVGWLASQNTSGVTLSTAGVSVTVLPITLFASGAVAMLLLWFGAKVMGAGMRRKRRQREQARRPNEVPTRTPVAGDSPRGTA